MADQNKPQGGASSPAPAPSIVYASVLSRRDEFVLGIAKAIKTARPHASANGVAKEAVEFTDALLSYLDGGAK